jgi:prevent-host-death family protein
MTMVRSTLKPEAAMRTVPAGVFKARCLAILDEVNATGEPVLVTKRGKPVARVVVPALEKKQKPARDSIFGFLEGMAVLVEGTDLINLNGGEDEDWDSKFLEDWDRIEKENRK